MPRSVKLNQQMRAESRRKILATAANLFSARGYYNVRMAEIASQAGMSPGNVYWYFPSKEELLKAILEDFFATYEAMLLEAETWAGKAHDKIDHLIDLQIDQLKTYGEQFNIYLSILGHGGPEFLKSLGFDTVEVGLSFHHHLLVILEAAVAEGTLPRQDLNALTVFFFSFFNGLLAIYGRDWEQIPAQSIRQAVLRMLGFL